MTSLAGQLSIQTAVTSTGPSTLPEYSAEEKQILHRNPIGDTESTIL